MHNPLRSLSGRFLAVWRRDLEAYRTSWKTSLAPPIVEALFYVFAFGLGFGSMVPAGTLAHEGRPIAYVQFLVPGVLAVGVLFTSFFECTYGSFVRMYYQKTFDAILATPVSIEEVILGEIAWGATRSVLHVSLMLAAIAALDATGLVGARMLAWPNALGMLPLALVGGWTFASLGMVLTSLVPRIQHFELTNSVLVAPLFLFSGTFFPIESLPAWGQAAAGASPLTGLAEAFRALALGGWPLGAALRAAGFLAALAVLLSALALVRMRRRLIV